MMSGGVYAFERENKLFLGNGLVEAVIQLTDNPCLASITNKLSGNTLKFAESQDCVLRLGCSEQRTDIPEWRFRPGSAEDIPPEEEIGYRAGFYKPDVDMTNWTLVRQLNYFPIGGFGFQEVVYPGYGWYRSTFKLPTEAKGKLIEFGLGGGDNYDWLHYWVYLNGTCIGQASPQGEWHEAPKYILKPEDVAYQALRFGEENVLAVQTRGLNRRRPEMSLPDAERYIMASYLVDQYVSVGPTYREVSEFPLKAHRVENDADQAIIELDLVNEAEGLALTIRWWVLADEGVIYKHIDVYNAGKAEHVLLEIDLQKLRCDRIVSVGGMGFPCMIGEEVFCGIQHPAGYSQGQDKTVRLRSLPGRKLEPGAIYESKVAMFGISPAGRAGEGFVHYIEKHGRRKKKLLHTYDIYGVYDNAGLMNPTEVTEELVLDNLDDLERLQKRGIYFDYYFIDTGWSNHRGDLKDFDPSRFPKGPAKIVEQLRKLGMKIGLWVSPSAGPMAFVSAAGNPVLDPSAMHPLKEGQPCNEYCLASEPYRTIFREALLYHVKENNVRSFKLDGFSYFCTNPTHGHMMGKYSVEPIVDSMIEIIEEVRRECLDIMFMYYWHFRSPWWLLHGETIYERGIWMEGATPSDFPARLTRQSVTISFDQGLDHSWDKFPLHTQDSLGVWITHTRWGAYMGKEGWQDAWVMDLARGSMLCQLWGDVSLFDEKDIQFLAAISAWAKKNSHLLYQPRRILGNPWKAEPYGYACFQGDEGVIFIYNPQFRQDTISLSLCEEIGFCCKDDYGPYLIENAYPGRNDVALSRPQCVSPRQMLDIPLDPFEVKMLKVLRADNATVPEFPVVEQRKQRSLALPSQLKEIFCEEVNADAPEEQWFVRRAINGRSLYVDREEGFEQHDIYSDGRDIVITHRRMAGKLNIPSITEKNVSLLTLAMVSRDGICWHHHALFDIIRLRASLNSENLQVSPNPSRWHEQAGAWSWIVFQIPLSQSSAGRQISLEIDVYLPRSVTIKLETWLFRD